MSVKEKNVKMVAPVSTYLVHFCVTAPLAIWDNTVVFALWWFPIYKLGIHTLARRS